MQTQFKVEKEFADVVKELVDGKPETPGSVKILLVDKHNGGRLVQSVNKLARIRRQERRRNLKLIE